MMVGGILVDIGMGGVLERCWVITLSRGRLVFIRGSCWAWVGLRGLGVVYIVEVHEQEVLSRW